MTIPQPTAATTIAITTGDVGNSSMCTASSPARPDRFRAKIRCDNNAPRPPRARKSAADPAGPPSRSVAEELHDPEDLAGSARGLLQRPAHAVLELHAIPPRPAPARTHSSDERCVGNVCISQRRYL